MCVVATRPHSQEDLKRHRIVSISSVECGRSEEHTSELQSQSNLVCRLLLEKKKKQIISANQSTARTLYISNYLTRLYFSTYAQSHRYPTHFYIIDPLPSCTHPRLPQRSDP